MKMSIWYEIELYVREQIVMENYDMGLFEECTHYNYRLTKSELREIASCCLLGLDFLHSQSIIHGVIDHSNDK